MNNDSFDRKEVVDIIVKILSGIAMDEIEIQNRKDVIVWLNNNYPISTSKDLKSSPIAQSINNGNVDKFLNNQIK